MTSWEGPQDLVFDYYGFPPESYKYSYPAKGSPQLAQRIVSLFRYHVRLVNRATCLGCAMYFCTP